MSTLRGGKWEGQINQFVNHGCQSEHIHFLWRLCLVSNLMQQSFTPVKPDVTVKAATDVIAFIIVIRIGSTESR